MTQVDDIKNRLDIVDIISEYVQLKPAGSNHKALCPFHTEKTPSFMVSRERQIYKCFGCGEGGDAFSFLMKMEGIEFPEALKILAEKAGVKLQYQDPQLASQKNTLFDIIERTANFWHQFLLESPQAQPARDYLKQRLVTTDMIDEFKLGYSPNSWEATSRFLQDRGFKPNDIFLAGLAVKKERGAGFYDRFRGRLMFPIADLHGRIVGFGGRTLDPNAKEAKYINSPQTLIYNKSLVIYNLDKAKSAIKENNLAIVVEGYMDVIASWQAGAKNVVASSGTAITLDQLQILKRYSENVAFSFDADLAGVNAAFRGIELALRTDLNLKLIQLPFGKDPDECIKRNPDDWFSACKSARPFMEYYFDKTLEGRNLNDVAQKKEVAKILLTIISKLGNTIEQSHWLQKLAVILNVPETILREALPKPKSVPAPDTPLTPAPPSQNRQSRLEEQFLALILKFTQHLPYFIDNLKAVCLTDSKTRELYKKLIIYYTKDRERGEESFDSQKFYHYLLQSSDNFPHNLAAYAQTLAILAERDFFDFENQQIKEEIIRSVRLLKKSYLSRQLKVVEERLRQAEAKGASLEIENLVKEFSRITGEINLLGE